MSDCILSIDQGTSSCRAILYDLNFNILVNIQKEFKQFYPREGWVEHDPIEIWEVQLSCCHEAISKAKIQSQNIQAIGITNQRETIVAWDRKTGKPIYNAIVWQDRRTSSECIQDIEAIGLTENQAKTGLSIDAYFSAPKIRWILSNVPEAKRLLSMDRLCISTIDSWLIWNMTKGLHFVTDFSNASRTNIFNIQTLQWDEELLDYYHIPIEILPKLVDSIGRIGVVDIAYFGVEIPITGIAGDQQAALYGHQCFEKGMIKNTFGTGCFLLQNIGTEYMLSENKLLTTVAWKEGGETVYAIEGSVFNAGSALKWLKENLNLIQRYSEIEEMCLQIPHTDGVYMVPAFTGLGAPYWDMYARGIIIGLTRNSNKAHIVRATIESLAFQTKDIIDTMKKDSGIEYSELRVDGGVSESRFLLQFLADILQIPIIRTESKECTAVGVAMMAAKGAGLSSKYNLKKETQNMAYYPKMGFKESKVHYERWEDAVERSMGWSK